MKKSKEILCRLEQSLDQIHLPNTDKVLIASSYYAICMEHYRSILCLLELGLYSSASSLLRCLFESYVKGMWFYYCSSQKDIDLLNKDKFNKKFSLLVDDVEKHTGLRLTKAKKNYWNALNGLTHSGAGQIGRRIDGTKIVSSFDDDFLQDVQKFANNYGLLAAGELALISGDNEAQSTYLSIYSESFHL